MNRSLSVRRYMAYVFVLLVALIISACGTPPTPPASTEKSVQTTEQQDSETTTDAEGSDNQAPAEGQAPAPSDTSGQAPEAQAEPTTAPVVAAPAAGEAVDSGVKPDATLGRIAFMGPYEQDLQVFVINPDGTGLTKVTANAQGSAFPSLSPDGQSVVYVSSKDGDPEIYRQTIGSEEVVRLTTSPGLDNQPIFSPDGTRVAFISDRDGDMDIWVMNADGTDPKLVVGRKGDDTLGSWSPDGQTLVFVKQTPQNVQNLWKVDLAVEGAEPVQLTEASGIDSAPVFSPDGSRIAFYSNRDGGKFNIFTMAPDGSDVQQLTSNGQDNLLPIYSPDGQWLVYGGAQGQKLSLYAMPAAGGTPTQLNKDVQGLPTSWTTAAAPLADTGFTQGPVDSGVAVNEQVLVNAPIRGNPDAPVTMIEFSDFQCPFCKRHVDQTEPSLEKYIEEGTVKVVWVDLPLAIHPQAPAAHRAAYCAREQGGDEAFWKMHDALFASQAQWSGQPQPDPIFKSVAEQSGFDGELLAACMAEGKYTDVVNAGAAEGARLQITGTPTFIINGERLVGAQPLQAFEQIINVAVQNAGAVTE